VAESDAIAAANALENMHMGEKRSVEKKGRFEIITEDAPESSATSQTVQRRGRFDIIEDNQRGSRSTSPTRASSPAPGVSRTKKPVQKGRFTVHSEAGADDMGVDLRYFSEVAQSAASVSNALRDLYAQAQAQASAIEELQDENARLRARIAELSERA